MAAPDDVRQHHVRYAGRAPVAMFVSQLEDAGADVQWNPPTEHRAMPDLAQAAGEALVQQGIDLVIFGTGYALRAVIQRFRDRHPDVEIEWREEDGYR